MDAGYLSNLRTNDFRCVFRYYYGVNANTDGVISLYDRTLYDRYMYDRLTISFIEQLNVNSY